MVDGSSVDVEDQYQTLSGFIISVQSALTHCSPRMKLLNHDWLEILLYELVYSDKTGKLYCILQI